MVKQSQLSDFIMVVASISWLVEAQHVSNNNFHMNNPNGDSNNRLFKVKMFYFCISLHTYVFSLFTTFGNVKQSFLEKDINELNWVKDLLMKKLCKIPYISLFKNEFTIA